MNSYYPQLKHLFKQIAFVFLLFTVCRILFFLFNYSSFQDLLVSEIPGILFYGLRFDAFSIAVSNALYILLCSLPFEFYHSKKYQRITSIVFIVANALTIALNFIDFAYFPFTQKRTTYEVFGFISGPQTDFAKLVPHFALQYWYVILVYALLVFILVKVHYRIKRSEKVVPVAFNLKTAVGYFFIFISLHGATLLGVRGGVQKVPIVLLDAANYTSAKYIPILINTPFSILKTTDLTEIEHLSFFPEDELKKIYSPVHPGDTGIFKNENVCVILLESFSKEFTKEGHRKSYTPFLDSLMTQSINFTNAISNGKTSINGVPAAIASMPCYLENQYLNSIYSNNTIQTLPNLLKEKNYHSVFYHGGTNGTMNFNSFAKLAGYDKYYGRTEYNNDKDYDGQWGIWDEPFLINTAKQISTLPQPFFTSIFTLSSHNPYKIPEKYKGKFPKGNYEITESIGYADYALKQFFNEASKQPWFKNTLFVITADHSSVSDDSFYSNIIGQYTIPLLIYKKDIEPATITKTVQHIDILPTVLDYLNYDKPYYSLGNSMFSTKDQPVLYYPSPNFYCVKDSFLYILSDYTFIEKYNYKTDSLLTTNILDNKQEKELLAFCKAYLQNYNNDLIRNQTYYKK